MKITKTTLRDKYDRIKHSGMFWELFPELTGEYQKDKEHFRKHLLQTNQDFIDESDSSFDPGPANPNAVVLEKDTETEMVGYYDKKFNGKRVDVYRVLKIFGITEPAQQHAIKKLLRAGKSIKTLEQDIDEVIQSLNRWKEMLKEDKG